MRKRGLSQTERASLAHDVQQFVGAVTARMSSKNRLATVFTEAQASRVIFTKPGDLLAHLIGRMRDREVLTSFEQVIRVVPGKGDEARATGECFEYANSRRAR
jgi:hypothetical protein